MNKTIQTVTNEKPAPVMVWGCISAHGRGELHICEGTTDAEAYVGILERHIAAVKTRTFPRNSSVASLA